MSAVNETVNGWCADPDRQRNCARCPFNWKLLGYTAPPADLLPIVVRTEG